MPSDAVMLVGALIPIAAIVIGGLILLIPVAGLSVRFVLKPAMEAFARTRQPQGEREEIRVLQQRLTLVEEQLRALSVVRMDQARTRQRGETPVQTVHVGRIAPLPVPSSTGPREG